MIQQKQFIITEQQAQGILSYLIERPFKEVAGFIQMFQTLSPFQVPIASKDIDAKD